MKTKVKAKSITLVNLKVKGILSTVGAALFISSVPLIFAHSQNNQLLVGTLVNLALFATAYKIGLFNAAIISPIPSLIALLRGLLPIVMAPLIPIIIISNIILIAVFSIIKSKHLSLKIAPAVLLKAGFIYTSAFIFFEIPKNFEFMISINQLITAAAGGVAFIILIQGLNYFKIKKNK